LLDTIQLQIKDHLGEDISLSEPLKTVYDMLVNLRDSLMQEQRDDNDRYNSITSQCDSLIDEYNDKIKEATKQIEIDEDLLDDKEEESLTKTAELGHFATLRDAKIEERDTLDDYYAGLIDEQEALIE